MVGRNGGVNAQSDGGDAFQPAWVTGFLSLSLSFTFASASSLSIRTLQNGLYSMIAPVQWHVADDRVLAFT